MQLRGPIVWNDLGIAPLRLPAPRPARV